MKNKILYMALAVLMVIILGNTMYAATATIGANKTSVTVGDSVTVTVTINAAAWNIKPSGAISGSVLAGFNMDGVNQVTTQTYKVDTSKAGTYTAYISGDITDADGSNPDINSSVVITVKEKPVAPSNNNTGTSSGSSSNNNSSTTTVKKSSDATLKALKVNIEGMNPTFNKNVFLYTLSVGSEVNSIKVTASTNHSKAKYYVSGNTNLKDGDNTVYITVTAENGTTKTYKIIVTKAENAEKANAYLTNIILDNAKFTEEFTREKLEYTLEDIEYEVDKLSLSVFPENTNATFEIQGADELVVGENIIKIIVTAEDTKTIKEYAIKVNRKEQIKEEVPSEVIEQNNLTDTKKNSIWDDISESAEKQLLILVYILAVVEFCEIVYLFVQLRKKDDDEKSYDNPFESNENKRRKK